MTRDEFFIMIRSSCATENDYLIELIKARGFLLVAYDNSIFVSDNGAIDDADYLQELLSTYGYGKLERNRIILNQNTDVSSFEELFTPNQSITEEVCTMGYSWNYFRNREHGEKVPVRIMEPFISRYVKAISACGVQTAGCCDGNHPHADKMFLQLSGDGSAVWHQIICDYVLRDRFKLNWKHNNSVLPLSPLNRYQTYYTINKAAEFIYNNRILLRDIKSQALSGMSRNYLKHTDSAIIASRFRSTASTLIGHSTFSNTDVLF